MAGRLREQASYCASLGSPMYHDLLSRVADDAQRSGVCADILAGHENDPGPSALGLRLAGSVHRLVLAGRASGLAPFYPSVGGVWESERGWEAFRRLLAEQPELVRERLGQPPQTNEVGRAAALMGGLLQIGEHFRLPVRLLEIGSSAGLNVRAERYCYRTEDGSTFGVENSPVRLAGAWRGRALRPWPEMEVVERIGSDVSPVDVGTAEGRLTLLCYVWPDQKSRIERLHSAFEVASAVPAEVRDQDAVAFVRNLRLAEGSVTVLWHSVMWQYLSLDDREEVTAGVESVGAGASARCPFAHLFLEPRRRTPERDHEFLVTLDLWPGGHRRTLGTSLPHGLPTVWE